MKFVGGLVLSSCLLVACDDGGAKSEPAPAASTPAPKPAPKVDPKAKELAAQKTKLVETVRTGYGLMRKAREEKWPAKCPSLEKAQVLLLPTYGAQEVMGGTGHKQMKHRYFEQTMSPALLAEYPRMLRDVEAARSLAETTHIAFVQITEHQAGKRVDEKTFSPGSLGGWVSVVDVAQKKGLCRFSVKASNSDVVKSVAMSKVEGLEGLNTQGIDADLMKSFARTLAARLEEDSQATLVDGEGPVATSKRYAPATKK